MPVTLGTQGQPDFKEPLELMMDCHRRIEHFLKVLQTLLSRHRNQPLDDQGRDALEAALDYFASAAPRHTEDEEQSLFPRMRRSDHPAICEAMAQLDRLEADHRQAEAAHARIDQLGRSVLASGKIDSLAHTELIALVDELSATYARHIQIEDEQVFVLAGRILDDSSLQQVGVEMRQRRIDDPGRAGSRCTERRKRQLSPQSAQEGETECTG